MKEVYADLHLCPDLANDKQVKGMITKAADLGYRLLAINLFGKFSEEAIQKIRRLCKEEGIDFASRIDLNPKTPRELIRNLRKIRRRFELVAVKCISKNISRQAAKDRRVDILNFPYYDPRRRFFDRAEAELASNARASFEVDMQLLLTLEGRRRIRLLSCLRREVHIAEKFHVPIVISSGATDELLMRRPLDTAALTSLFDLSSPLSIQAISTNPMTIIKRNREKLHPSFIAPGVRLIRKGRDC